MLVGPCGNFSYNLDCKAAIRLVKPPTYQLEVLPEVPIAKSINVGAHML
jgi:hypothetical protein